MRRLFGTDGVRGVANEFLDCELAMKIGRALGSVISSNQKYRPTVLIGMDTRLSSEMLASAISAGLLSVGSDVMECGVLPTPAIAYLVKKYGAKAGVVISASHNTYEYNGIKIFGEDGFKLSDELEEKIEELVLDSSADIKLADRDKIGKKLDTPHAFRDYTDYVISCYGTNLKGLRVAIDTSFGAASQTAKTIFSSLGADAHVIFDTPNGININKSCGSTHLEALKSYVLKNGMDVGIAFDGDADRCLAVDERGQEVDGDFIMAMLALDMKESGELSKNTVVGTVMTNLGFQRFCEESGINFIAAKVGDRYVIEMMNQEGYSFGGEQSGHIIIRKHSTTGDGQLTATALLSLIAKKQMKLSELSSVMKKYPQCTVNITAEQNQKIALFTDGQIKAIIEDAEQLLGKNGRLVVRPSGTEPLIRIMVEYESDGKTAELASLIANKIKAKLAEYS